MAQEEISSLFLSQEDLINSGCFDMKLAISAAEEGLKAFMNGEIFFPDKTVQIFDTHTQERINCLPATLLSKKVCGMKWVSVFPENPSRFGLQNLSAVILLSGIEKGFPLCFMDGTLCSNMRVAAIGAIAAKHLAVHDPETIGFIGVGEQAKMHLVGMKSAFPKIKFCQLGGKNPEEEKDFISQMQPLFPDMDFRPAGTDLQKAVDHADIIVTATTAYAPLLKASWMKEGAFYSHIGGWEDEFDVALQCEKIVCDDWEAVKHRDQTLAMMYSEGKISDGDIYGNLGELVIGEKPGREDNTEKAYFNAVGLSYIDISIAFEMFRRAETSNAGRELMLQEKMIFRHENLAEKLKV